MKLPKRPDTRVTEDRSWILLQSAAPTEWIPRDVSRRDYGIDCYFEITKNGHITGELFFAQLKGVEQPIKWKGKKEEIGPRAVH